MPRATKSANPYPFSNTIGPQFKKERTKRGLSDIKFAKRAGVSRRHLVELQKGANPTLLVTFKAMGALGLTELTHTFDAETLSLTLKLKHTPANIHPATLIETAERMEQAVASLAECAALLRGAGSVKASEAPTSGEGTLAAKASAEIADFIGRFHDLDPDAKIDVLHLLAEASSSSSSPQQQTGTASAASTRKRRTKTAV